MLETHPFGCFVPLQAKYLLLGSFIARIVPGYDWYYSNGRNQFWPILEQVYGVSLKSKKEKQALFTRLKMAITDIILHCERRANNNLDTNLTNIIFNTQAITDVIRKNMLEKIYFSSRFAEKLFKKQFKDLIEKYPKIKLITLPSPSPRYAVLTKQEKAARYKHLLPKLVSKT